MVCIFQLHNFIAFEMRKFTADQPFVCFAVLMGRRDFRICIVIMENVSCQFYIDFMPGNSEVFKIAAGDVITSFLFIVSVMVNCHARNHPIRREHVRDVDSFDYRPCMGCVNAMAVVITSSHF